MTNDSNFDNSSNNIQKFFSDNIIGDIHMSQYRDPNDEASSYNSGDTQDPCTNQDLIIHQLNHKELFGLNQDNQDDLNSIDNDFNLKTNNIRFIVDQTKHTHIQADKKDATTMDDPFKTFLTANDNPINLHKRILISQKRDTPTITKKFQAHPLTQLPKTTKPMTKDNNVLKDPNITPTNDPNKITTSVTLDKSEVIPTNTTDQQTTEQEFLIMTNLTTTEENIRPPDNSNNDNSLCGQAVTITDPQNDDTSIVKGLVITPNNRNTSKRIINPYAKNQQTSTTPSTDPFQTINTIQGTPNLIPPKTINFNHTEKIATPSSNVSHNTTLPLQFHHNHIHKDTKNINTNVNLINPFLLNIKQAPNSSIRNLNLPQELEPLRTVVLSQHTALENHIKELGFTCLNFTTVIEQKKESANKLHTDKRIPRSLRIKCELSTSPSYENNSDFITLKKELQDAVNTFTNKGLNVMKKWSLININLLTQDRCHNIMQRALVILDGLYTYWKNILDPIHWPSPIENNPILFLIKIYFNEDSNPDITELINFFELSSSEILIIITKIITKNTNNTLNIQLLNSLDVNSIDNLSETQIYLITETLKSFDNTDGIKVRAYGSDTLQYQRYMS
jgi:hypothetical protein